MCRDQFMKQRKHNEIIIAHSASFSKHMQAGFVSNLKPEEKHNFMKAIFQMIPLNDDPTMMRKCFIAILYDE